MEIATANQDEYMFTLGDNEAYAGTDADIWQAIRAFNKLKVIDLNGLLPEDRSCAICTQPYDALEDEATKHVPIRLPCLHFFGKECLAKWITPFGAWENNMDGRWEEERRWFHNPVAIDFFRSTSCPLCRRSLFQKPQTAESAMGLEARIMLRDRAYEKIGCRRSEKEEQSRSDLVQYIQFYREANGDTIEETETDIEQRWTQLEKYHKTAMVELFYFVLRRKHEEVLTPIQARLNCNLFHISIEGLDITVDNPRWKQFTEMHEDWEDRIIDQIYNQEYGEDEYGEDDDSIDDDSENDDSDNVGTEDSDSGNDDNEDEDSGNVDSDSGNNDNEDEDSGNVDSDSGNNDNEDDDSGNVDCDSGNNNKKDDDNEDDDMEDDESYMPDNDESDTDDSEDCDGVSLPDIPTNRRRLRFRSPQRSVTA